MRYEYYEGGNQLTIPAIAVGKCQTHHAKPSQKNLHEEGRLHIVRVQEVDELSGILIRAVIEGQSHLSGLGQADKEKRSKDRK
jgi:hypothetical protein